MFQDRLMLLQLFVVVLACWVGPSESFGVTQRAAVVTGCSSTSTSTSLHMFGGLKDAFKNDDALGTRPNEGLKGGPNYNDQVTVNGVAVKGAVVGQKLTVVASKVRVKIPVNCQKGDCGTCVVSLNGRKVKGTRSDTKLLREASRLTSYFPLMHSLSGEPPFRKGYNSDLVSVMHRGFVRKRRMGR
jgi:ferredoxin